MQLDTLFFWPPVEIQDFQLMMVVVDLHHTL